MTYNPEIHHRRSIRLPGYDYAQSGAYFVTVCAYQQESVFGGVVDGGMVLNDWGRIVDQFWVEVSLHFPVVTVDLQVTMPNHVHAIIVIAPDDTPRRGGVTRDCRGGVTPPLQPALGQIVAYYKYQTTKTINLMRNMPGVRLWQRNYWEHVIRDEAEMNRIREYIETNPARWADDQLHPAASSNQFNRG